jgi:hypothetical protein
MITRKFILLASLIFSASFFFYSCLEDDVQTTVYSDAFIESVQRGDSVLYGVHFWVYSSGRIAGATVNSENESTNVVLDSMAGRYTFSHVPDSTEFTTSKPVKANYIFKVNLENGEQSEVTDLLDSSALKPVVIKKCYFDSLEKKIYIDWDVNSLASSYRVVLEDENHKIAFISDLITFYQTDLSIYLFSTGWVANMQPEGGEKFKVTISAYQYEPYASDFDLQSISVAKSSYIEWISSY